MPSGLDEQCQECQEYKTQITEKMEETKELQNVYKIFRTLIYVTDTGITGNALHGLSRQTIAVRHL